MNNEKLKSEQIKKMRIEAASLAETVSKDRQDILANAIDNPDNPACPARPQEIHQVVTVLETRMPPTYPDNPGCPARPQENHQVGIVLETRPPPPCLVETRPTNENPGGAAPVNPVDILHSQEVPAPHETKPPNKKPGGAAPVVAILVTPVPNPPIQNKSGEAVPKAARLKVRINKHNIELGLKKCDDELSEEIGKSVKNVIYI